MKSTSVESAIAAWTRALVRVAELLARQRPAESENGSRYPHLLSEVYGLLESVVQRTASPLPHAAGILREALAEAPLNATLLERSYERLVDHAPVVEEGRFALEPAPGRRKAQGRYFTPRSLRTLLLEHTLRPTVYRRLWRGVLGHDASSQGQLVDVARWSKLQRRRGIEVLLSTTICDPACGPGGFLHAAGRWMAQLLLQLRGEAVDDTEAQAKAYREVARHCLYGVDLDPVAIRVARLALKIGEGPASHHDLDLTANLRFGDSLGMVDDTTPSEGAPDPRPIRWEQDFPHSGSNAGRFDVMVGNPPFANAIEGLVAPEAKARLSRRYPEIAGTADLAYYFLAMAHQQTHPEGAVGFVLPRGILTARSARRLRQQFLAERPPSLVYAPKSQYLFPGANIFVVLLALQKGVPCVGSRENPQRDPNAAAPPLSPVVILGDNWWAPLLTETVPSRSSRQRLGDAFEVFASMTAAMAYELQPYLVDGASAPHLKLVTTGLIEPASCMWGQRVCRYLKRDFAKPGVNDSHAMPPSLRKRLARVRRPKVLVAGLSNRVEAFLDPKGEFCGAVSTFTILHPLDDVDELARVADYLNGPEVSKRLLVELGAHAMGGGRITLTKQFLKQLPLP